MLRQRKWRSNEESTVIAGDDARGRSALRPTRTTPAIPPTAIAAAIALRMEVCRERREVGATDIGTDSTAMGNGREGHLILIWGTGVRHAARTSAARSPASRRLAARGAALA